jgi:hypothetical protein
MDWLIPLVAGAVGVILSIVFGLDSRKYRVKYGEEKSENANLKKELERATKARMEATRARPTVDQLRRVAGRMSGIKPEDN